MTDCLDLIMGIPQRARNRESFFPSFLLLQALTQLLASPYLFANLFSPISAEGISFSYSGMAGHGHEHDQQSNEVQMLFTGHIVSNFRKRTGEH